MWAPHISLQIVVCDIGYFPITIIAHNCISQYDIYHDIQTHHSACVFTYTLVTLVAVMYYYLFIIYLFICNVQDSELSIWYI